MKKIGGCAVNLWFDCKWLQSISRRWRNRRVWFWVARSVIKEDGCVTLFVFVGPFSFGFSLYYPWFVRKEDSSGTEG